MQAIPDPDSPKGHHHVARTYLPTYRQEPARLG